MRVLVATVPAVGHVLPMAPLIAAMVADGDEVTVAAHPTLAPHVERTGAALWPSGSDEPTWFARLSARTRGAPGDGLAPSRIDHYFVPRAFGEIGTDDLVDDVLACAESVRPHLVVAETYAFVGPLVAAARGVPCAQHLLGPLLDAEVLDLANDAVAPLWRTFGLEVPGYAGCYETATIRICPPSLDVATVPRGATLWLRPAPLPLEGPRAMARPLVYVTLGTFFSGGDVFRTILGGLAAEDVDVLVTVGSDGDPGALAPLPANATVERFVPQASLLPGCAVVVHHGGGGTTFGALAHGLPQVVLPQGADNFTNARLLEASGASCTLLPDEVTGDAVRDAVRRALDDASMRTAAQALASSIREMPAPEDVAAALRALATER
jgi:UDP:flavonoid glycosyltransferase YjiC (YdhE family)